MMVMFVAEILLFVSIYAGKKRVIIQTKPEHPSFNPHYCTNAFIMTSGGLHENLLLKKTINRYSRKVKAC